MDRVRPAVIAAVAAGSVVGAGCVSGTVPPLPPAPRAAPSAAVTTTTAAAPLRALSAVSGETTTTSPSIGPGGTTITGTVTGPQGAVSGAVVQAERVTDSGTAVTDAVTDSSGVYTIAGVLGGRYRIRAWMAPTLAMAQPVVLFLSDGQSHQVQLQLDQYGRTQLMSSIAPSPPVVGEPAQLVVQLTTSTVDPATGVVRATGMAGATVTLTGSAEWVVTGTNPTTTDGGGRARWQLVCEQGGSQPLTVQVSGGGSFPVSDVPACAG